MPQPGGVASTEHELPATAQPADFRARSISFLIDLVAPLIMVNVLLAAGAASESEALRLLTVVGYLGVVIFILGNSGYLQGSTGQSIGRRVARTKLVRIDTGQPIGFGRALLRQCCHIVLIGYLWPLWDAKHQTLADKIVGTVVTRVEGAAGSATDPTVG